LNCPFALRQQQINVGSPLQQSRLLVRHRKILDQSPQPRVIQRNHHLICESLQHNHIRLLPNPRPVVYQHQHAHNFFPIAQRDRQHCRRSHIGHNFSRGLQCGRFRCVLNRQRLMPIHHLTQAPDQFGNRRCARLLETLGTKLFQRGRK